MSHDLRNALRSLRMSPVFATVTIVAALQMVVTGQACAQAGTLPSAAAMKAELDSLEHVVLTAADATEQARAALSMTDVGRLTVEQTYDRKVPVTPVYPGVVARLARIYRQSTNPSVRNIIVHTMPLNAERAEAAAFLGKVASEAPKPTPPSSGFTLGNDAEFSRQHRAVYELSVMGAEGRAELERLHAAGSVRDPSAKAYLEKLAKDGYRVKSH